VDELEYQVKLLERIKKELKMSLSDIARRLDIQAIRVSKWIKRVKKMPKSARIALECIIQQEEGKKINRLLSASRQKREEITT